MDKLGSETADLSGEIEAEILQSMLNSYAPDIHRFANTPSSERAQYYNHFFDNETFATYAQRIDWDNPQETPKDPLVLNTPQEINFINNLLTHAETNLTNLEGQPGVLKLLAAEANQNNPLTVAEQFGPDIVDGRFVIRAENAEQGRYIRMRSLTHMIRKLTLPVSENRLLLAVPALLLLRDLNMLLSQSDPKTGFTT